MTFSTGLNQSGCDRGPRRFGIGRVALDKTVKYAKAEGVWSADRHEPGHPVPLADSLARWMPTRADVAQSSWLTTTAKPVGAKRNTAQYLDADAGFAPRTGALANHAAWVTRREYTRRALIQRAG